MEFDIVSNPHPHPLIFYRQEKPEDEHKQGICCSKCGKLFCPPAFCCSKDDCNFNVHQSCLHLPRKILSPVHTHDPQIETPLFLTFTNNFPCIYCGKIPYGASYSCDNIKCRFVMDLQCAIADPNASSLLKMAISGGGGGEFLHFSHPHPLTLHLETDPERENTLIPICLVCQRLITSPSNYYFCSRSLSNCHSYTFHQHCAEMPRQIQRPDLHPDHPLFLFALPWRENTSTPCLCLCCKSECTNFFYSCQPCDFNLHVDCISSFKHKHNFHILRNKISYKCQLCNMSATGFPWLCTVCHQFAHEKCAIRQMSQAQYHHPSTQLSNNHHVFVNPNNNSIMNLDNRIQHFSHKQHKLTLCLPREDMHCDGCMRCISTPSQSYACPPCGFYLHQECATLPTQHNNSFLHLHKLTMVYIPDFVFSCAVCLQYCHGFAYRCEECHYAIDIRCAAIAFPFTHSSHPHPMSYYNGKMEHKCEACGEELKYKKTLGCEDCNFYLDIRCAHMPLGVRNRFDEHPLILTFVNEDKNNSNDEYYCDICEEERNVKEWFYQCRPCGFTAHPNCILGDYPFLKSAKFGNHMHPLSLVNECKKKRNSTCGACGENSCDGKLAFECGKSMCKFSVHAFGQCYHKQLTQGQITNFTMPSLRYRSICLHLHPDEIKWWKLISFNNMEVEVKDECSPTLSFVSQGLSFGEDWDDGVFSSIRAFRIYSFLGAGRYIRGIQIQYEDKDGNSIWKDKHGGGNLDTKIEVTLNHMNEYLISIHGCYDDYAMRSLTFETNQRTLGPYGTENDDPKQLLKFSFPTNGVKIVGLHGRSHNNSLCAIGFHFVNISIPKVEL